MEKIYKPAPSTATVQSTSTQSHIPEIVAGSSAHPLPLFIAVGVPEDFTVEMIEGGEGNLVETQAVRAGDDIDVMGATADEEDEEDDSDNEVARSEEDGTDLGLLGFELPDSSYSLHPATPPSVYNEDDEALDDISPPVLPEKTSAVTLPSTLSDHAPPRDLLPLWPYPLPDYLLHPSYTGEHPPPPVPSAPSSISYFSFILLCLAHAFSGTFNVPQRAVGLFLDVISIAIHWIRQQDYRRYREAYHQLHPFPNSEDLQVLDRLNPSNEPRQVPSTLNGVLHLLEVDQDLIIHPQCPRQTCHQVFYDIVSPKDFKKLPEVCPACGHILRPKGKFDALHFGRRTIKQELEVVFKVPGVEDAIAKRSQRREQRRREDEEASRNVGGYSKVYREQDDGEAWDSLNGSDGAPFERPRTDGELAIRLNLGIDWANPNSNRASAQSSMGPITLQIADLPNRMRSSFPCMLVVGVTPGPKETLGRNLWKILLPLVLEIRAAEMHGLWVRTPAFPNGRLIRVGLACLCADRPACVMLTGGPHFKRKDAPCLRCTISQPQIKSLQKAPSRDSRTHGEAILRQHAEVPLAVARAESAYLASPRSRRKRDGTIKPWPDAERKRVEAEAGPIPGHISALDLLPWLEKFPAAPFDPMHSILEGAVKTYIFKVFIQGEHDTTQDGGDSDGVNSEASMDEMDRGALRTEAQRLVDAESARPDANERLLSRLRTEVRSLGSRKRSKKRLFTPSDRVLLQELMASVIVPTLVGKIHPRFGEAEEGSPTADQWRSVAEVYGPLVFPVLWIARGPDSLARSSNPHLTVAELDAVLRLFEIVNLALRSSISNAQIDRLEHLMISWQYAIYRLHPTLDRATNLHTLTHLADDIRRHGPVYGWWNFQLERVNFIMKNTNRSGGSSDQAQVVAYRAVLRSREVDSVRMRKSKETAQADMVEGTASVEDFTLRERTASELRSAYGKYIKSPTMDALEDVAFQYAEENPESVLLSLDQESFVTVGRTRVRFSASSRLTTLNPIDLDSLKSCLQRTGATPSPPVDPRSTNAQPGRLNPMVQLYKTMYSDGRRFDSAEWSDRLPTNPSSLTPLHLPSCRDSLIEIRSNADRYSCLDDRRMTAVVCSIFQHPVTASKPRVFMVLRKLIPFTGPGVVDYRN